jgi:hypothetical protein
MRILHLSDSTLPDSRIEKSAFSSKKKGDSVCFGGPVNKEYRSVFEEMYEITWTSGSRNKYQFQWNSVKKQMKNVIQSAKPDVIHAHDIFTAKMVTEIDNYPLVYDDHEFWSMLLKTKQESYRIYLRNDGNKKSDFRKFGKNVLLKLLKTRFARIWTKSEKEIVMNHPVISVSKPIVEEHRKYGKHIFLVPNFPNHAESDNIPEPVYQNSLSSVYAGVQMKGPIKNVHLNLEGFFEMFQHNNIGNMVVLGWKDVSAPFVTYQGYLDRNQMYQQMHNNSIGVIPFKKHWFHRYISPNKAYEYAHAGLLVMYTSDLIPISDHLQGHCIPFEDYEDLKNQLHELANDLESLYSKRINSYRFAHTNLLWENFENNIYESYKVC